MELLRRGGIQLGILGARNRSTSCCLQGLCDTAVTGSPAAKRVAVLENRRARIGNTALEAPVGGLAVESLTPTHVHAGTAWLAARKSLRVRYFIKGTRGAPARVPGRSPSLPSLPDFGGRPRTRGAAGRVPRLEPIVAGCGRLHPIGNLNIAESAPDGCAPTRLVVPI